MDEHRWIAAQVEIGRRHPYLTVFGGRILRLLLLVAVLLLGWWLWSTGRWLVAGMVGGAAVLALIGFLTRIRRY